MQSIKSKRDRFEDPKEHLDHSHKVTRKYFSKLALNLKGLLSSLYK